MPEAPENLKRKTALPFSACAAGYKIAPFQQGPVAPQGGICIRGQFSPPSHNILKGAGGIASGCHAQFSANIV